jgi:hypothetical protein
MIFEINPYVGAGKLFFGMTTEQIQGVLGPPDFSRRERTAVVPFFRTYQLRLSVDQVDGLREIEFLDHADIRFRQTNLWGDGLLKVARQDPAAVICGAVLVLPQFGIASTGFHNDEPSERSIAVFRRGVWDDYPQKKPWLHKR